MHALFVIQGEFFELRSGIQVSEGDSLWPLSELHSGVSLRDVLWDDLNLQAARRALAEMEGPSVIFGWDNYRVLNALAHHIASRSLVLRKIERPAPPALEYIGEEGSPPPEPAPPPAEEPQESPEEEEEEENSAAEAQAEALVEAAEAGVPFCEECEKAKAAQQAEETASAAPEEVDAEAQAATLTQAAEAGVPFCEECEKAKKAQGGV